MAIGASLLGDYYFTLKYDSPSAGIRGTEEGPPGQSIGSAPHHPGVGAGKPSRPSQTRGEHCGGKPDDKLSRRRRADASRSESHAPSRLTERSSKHYACLKSCRS